MYLLESGKELAEKENEWRIKEMETTINFLKNGVTIAFYGILMIIGISLLYGMIKEVLKKLFNWRK